MKDFAQLKKTLPQNSNALTEAKVAILGDSATQFLNIALRGTGFDYGFNLNIWEADFNQIERQVFDSGSELYEFNPDIVIIFQCTHKLMGKYNKLPPHLYSSFANEHLELVKEIASQLTSTLGAKIIYYNFPEIDDAIFGNYANKIDQSFLFQLRKLNYELMVYAASHPNFFICDLASIQNQVGKSTMFDTSLYVNTDMVLSINILPIVGLRTIDLIGSIYGKSKKCIIIDLDNTTWGGIIGDDGLENIEIGNLGIGKAFTEFQYWIKKLKNRGIIIAVCSKNTESVAKEPFQNHPDMVLRLDDIAVFVANWENKVDNIHKIQNILNIGFDSMVFLDDNSFERNLVKENIPLITVPELPEDPADYLEYLYKLNLFETVSFVNDDEERTKRYQVESKRSLLKTSFVDEDAFLKSLDMRSRVDSFNKFNTPRVAQLSQRSNQFNLRTIRYTESDIENLLNNKDVFTFAFTLEDQLGDHGLISAVILKMDNSDTLFIDTWFMSCRVLKRGMEKFILNTLIESAKNAGFNYLKGEYIPTIKNEMVKTHYKDLGFEEKEEYWLLNVKSYIHEKCYITKK